MYSWNLIEKKAKSGLQSFHQTCIKPRKTHIQRQIKNEPNSSSNQQWSYFYSNLRKFKIKKKSDVWIDFFKRGFRGEIEDYMRRFDGGKNNQVVEETMSFQDVNQNSTQEL